MSWKFTGLRGDTVTWYSEEEFNELKLANLKLQEENEMLKSLLEAHKIMIEAPVEIKGV